MAEKLTFSGMSWNILESRYGLRVEDSFLFGDSTPVEPSAILLGSIQRARRTRLPNEMARAHRLIDPVLAELETFYDGKITTIPEMYLEVAEVEGLSGNPDFIISAGSLSSVVPIVAIVEAKKDDVDPGLPQCAAEVYASYLFDKGALDRVYGCVTTGWDWKFLHVDGKEKRIVVDRSLYSTFDLPPLLGVFRYVVGAALSGLRRT